MVGTSEFIHLCHLGFGQFPGEHATHSLPSSMDVQHDLGGQFVIHAEEETQHFDDKIHWCVVVIKQQHPIQRRRLYLSPFGGKYNAMIVLGLWVGFVFVIHAQSILMIGTIGCLQDDCRATVRMETQPE